MKNISFDIRFLAVAAVMAWTLPLHAAGPIEVRWTKVCEVAGGHQLTITTVNGDTVDGYCLSINVDQIAVTAENRRVVTIARAALSRIEMSRSRNTHHQLRSLGRGMRTGLRQGTDWLLSPCAPLGLVVVPGTLAWGAIAAPFCLLGDLKNKVVGKQEIKVL
jgi:hypothetical protein